MVPLRHPVICIGGPTASGKTALAVEISHRLNAEIVSADSMQVYRGMDIGTGKHDGGDCIVRYGIDLTSPDRPYSAALFQSYARDCFMEIERRGKRAILVGGTGLYVRAALDDLVFPSGEQTNNPIRQYYEDYAKAFGPEALWQLLFEKDPQSAQVIHPNNTRRVVRALEMAEEGISYADQKEGFSHVPQAVPAYFIGLEVSPEILKRKIESRIERMLEEGWLDEVCSLCDAGLKEAVIETGAIGYADLILVLEGKLSLDEACERIQTATRRYAKRQRTWLRRDKRTHWVCADEGITSSLIEEVLAFIALCDENPGNRGGESDGPSWKDPLSIV